MHAAKSPMSVHVFPMQISARPEQLPTAGTASVVAVAEKLGNVATHVNMGAGDKAIGGLIVTGNQPKQVIVRAIGPSLNRFGIGATLADPTLEFHDQAGAALAANDKLERLATGQDPGDWPRASGRVKIGDRSNVALGAYTAVVAQNDGATSTAVVEVYD